MMQKVDGDIRAWETSYIAIITYQVKDDDYIIL